MTVRPQKASLLDGLTSFEIAERFDEWMQTLPQDQYAWVADALQNAQDNLPNVGEQAARHLVAAILLFYRERRVR